MTIKSKIAPSIMPAGPQVRLQRLLALQQYDEAQRFIAQCKARMAELYKASPVVWVRRLLLGQRHWV